MKELNIKVDGALLEILKNLPEIKIQQQSSEKNISFEQATDYTLE